MLRSVKEIKGYKLVAKDGELGDIDGFIIDEDNWNILYFLAGIGGLLRGRKAFISPLAVRAASREEKTLVTDLSVGQVKSSPVFDPDRPLSRRQMDDLDRYYGWEPYRGKAAVRSPAYEAVRAEAEAYGGETNTIRLNELAGYRVLAADGEVGGIDDLLVDDDWVVRYIVADTRKWLPGRKALLSPEWIEVIDEKNRSLKFGFPKEVILMSPEYDPAYLNRDYELRLFGYYRREGYWMREKRAA